MLYILYRYTYKIINSKGIYSIAIEALLYELWETSVHIKNFHIIKNNKRLFDIGEIKSMNLFWSYLV